MLYGVLHIPSVQTWLVQKIAGKLSKELKTKVSVKSVDFSFYNKLDVQGVLIEDRKQDTLLYAGSAKIKITDWFFFKDHVTLEYIGLENGVVNLNRTDSTWNYQFLIDYFGGGSTGKKKSGNTIEFDFKEVHCKNIRFNNIDGWTGQNMIASMKQMDVFIDSVNLTNKSIHIRQVDFDQPYFALSDYTGKKPYTPKPESVNTDPSKPVQWNPDGWIMKVAKVTMKDGSFASDQETERTRYTDMFDGQHLLISTINGEIENVVFAQDTLRAEVNLSARERSGFTVKKIQASMKFSPDIMEFNNLDLITNKSHLKNYYAMHYSNFNDDMQDFLHSVALEGRFTDSELNSDDLAYFAPALASWKRIFYFNGRARGTIDNLSARDMKIKSGNTFVDGDIALRGLPDINQTFIDFKGNNLQTTYQDLATIIPSLKNITQPQLSRLGNIRYTGNFTGFINDFVAYGTIRSDLGTITTDINMKLPDNAPPKYSGKIFTDNFRLGMFITNGELGDISMNGEVKGSGFTLKELDANFNGTIRQLQFKDYNYQNIAIDGDFEKSLFKGHLTIDDPNLKITSLDGTLSLAGKKEIAFDLNASLEHANLKNIHFTKEDFSLAGLFSLHFTGNNIDNFLGTARVYDAQLKHDSTLLSFDSLTLNSFLRDEKKYLSLQTNELDAELNGKFKILELPDAFKVFLSRYYPAYIKKPSHTVSDQDFSFDIQTREVDPYMHLLDNRLAGFNNSSIKGHLNLSNAELSINASVPNFTYDKKVFNNVNLAGNGNGDTLNASVTADDIAITDSLHLPSTTLHLTAHNDISEIHLLTSASQTLNNAELNATVQTYTDRVKIHFSPSSFIINDKKWNLEKDGELIVGNEFLSASEIKFSHEKQQLTIATEPDDETNQTHIVAKLKDISLEDFTPFVFKDPSLKGLVTGTAIIKNPFGKPILNFKGTADSFYMNDKYVGKVEIENVDANTATGKIKYKAYSDDTTNTFTVEGSYDLKDTTGNALNLEFMGKKINIDILEPYMKSVFSRMSGPAQTNLKIYSKDGKQYITGDTRLINDTIRIGYTQCTYILKDQQIQFRENEIDLGHLLLKDTLQNEGALSGKIAHHFFSDLNFKNVNLETGKLILLNTTRLDNSQFYGYVIGRANLKINGPTTNMIMDISGEPSKVDSSHIFLPTGEGREAGAIDYIDFVQYGSQMEDELAGSDETNIIVNLALQANPACKIDVILDEETGDVVKGQGNGLINIRVGNKEPLTIRGRYELTKGQYTFNFQTFLKKPFTLNKGSISWTGDPYLANLDIEAEYLAKKVDISSLAASGRLVQKENVTIVGHIKGLMKQPDKPYFEFKLDENSDAAKDYIITKRLDDFQNDENEMYKQVASLLLFNSFISNEQNFLSGGKTVNIATNTIGGVISGWLTGLFNKQLEKATNGVLSFYLDIDPTLDIQKNASQLQANIKAVFRLLFSSRLVLLVGGNLDYNNPTYTQQLDKRNVITPDINIEWLLNKEGSVRVVGFNRSSFDFALNQRNRSGIQLTYRKDIDKVGDIFRSKKKAAKRAAAATKQLPVAAPAKLP